MAISMNSVFEIVLVFACIFVTCIMPEEWGIKTEDNVTPAPAIVLSDIIDLDPGNEVSQKPKDLTTDINVKLENPREKENQVEFLKRKIYPPRKKLHGKKREKQPICKYVINELFLYGQYEENSEKNMTSTSPPLLPLSYGSVHNDTLEVEEPDGNDTTLKVEEDVEEANMKLKVTDVHSFEEWKSLKLKEQVSKKPDSETAPARTVRAKKSQVNYGSQDCGAKVLAHNKEAKHVSAILDENRDVYMLNPCSNSIWFVIELCEPIQVQQVQVGNLELFSSAPKEFAVSVSERYPTREWHSLGVFEAANDRTLQSFYIASNDAMFAKYVKFEMKSHFSNEHFCPLTLVRVMGVSMVDEFDDSDQTVTKTETEDEGDYGSPDVISEDSQQHDNGAINTMLNMVKNAIGYAEKSKNEPDKTDIKPEEIGESNSDSEAFDPVAESEISLVINHTEIVAISSNDYVNFSTKDEEVLSKYIANATLYSPHIPLYVPNFIKYMSPVTGNLNAKVCWFLEFMCKVSLSGCLVHYPFNYSVFVPISFASHSHMKKHRKSEENPTNSTMPSARVEWLNLADTNASSSKEVLHLSNFAKHEIVANETLSDDGQIPTTGKEIDGVTPSESPTGIDLVSNEPVKVESCDVAPDIESTLVSEDLDNIRVKDELNVFIKPSVTDKSTSNIEEPMDISTTSNDGEKKPAPLKAISNQHTDKTVQDKQIPTPTVKINPLSPKDSVFMRLSNRIRVLEQNMSLSSDYLENLSRRYKEQMDEMQRAFNKTTSKLVATSRTANENDAKQTELLKKAEAEIELLKQQINSLATAHEQLNNKLVERHLCLIVLELFLFIAVFVTCLGRRMSRTQENLERSDDMVKQLTNILKNIERHQTKESVANGHCHPIQVDNPDSVIAENVHKQQKWKKKKLKRKNSKISASAEISITVSEEHRCTNGVENIGTSHSAICDNGSCCNQDKIWNANQLDLKVPETYIKGRK